MRNLLKLGAAFALAIALVFGAAIFARGTSGSYTETVRIVDSLGNVIDNGIASAATGSYNATVRIVNSTGQVMDSLGASSTIYPNTAPTAGQVPVGNAGGTAYTPQTITPDCTITSAGTITCTKAGGGTGAFQAGSIGIGEASGGNPGSLYTTGPLGINGSGVGCGAGICVAGGMGFGEGASITPFAGLDYLYGDSTSHRFKVSENGAAYAQLVQSGVDINTSDQVTATHGGLATMWSGITASVAGSGTDFIAFGEDAGEALISTEANAKGIIPYAATASHLYCVVATAAGASGDTFTVDLGGVAQTLTCTVTNTNTTCNDTTHTFAVAAGNQLDIKVTAGTNATGVASCGFVLNG